MTSSLGCKSQGCRAEHCANVPRERTRRLHSDIAPVPVAVTASRVPNTGQINITASSTSDTYARVFLDSLLDEMAAVRKEMFQSSAWGTVERVNQEILRREKRVKDLDEKLKTGSSQKAPQEKLDKLKAQLGREREDYRVWLAKAEQLDTSAYPPPPPDFKILERPNSTKDFGK